MALQQADLFVVQQGVTVKSVDYGTLSSSINSAIASDDLPIATAGALGAIRVGANLAIDPVSGILEATLPAAISFKGGINPVNPAPAAAQGDAYIVNADGIFDTSFQNIASTTGSVGDLCIYEGAAGQEWNVISGLFGVGVISLRGTTPIVVDSSDARNPVISITPATATVAGSMSAIDKDKLDNIQDGADVGTVTKVSASLPLEVLDGTTEPVISVRLATPFAVGVVRLADSTAIANGTSDRVIDASQLKVVSDEVAALELKVDTLSLYNFLGDDPIVVNVDASDNVTYSIKDASNVQKGAARFATSAEAEAGAATNFIMSPQSVASYYLVKDFSTLTSI